MIDIHVRPVRSHELGLRIDDAWPTSSGRALAKKEEKVGAGIAKIRCISSHDLYRVMAR